jgi:hypothetical protein
MPGSRRWATQGTVSTACARHRHGHTTTTRPLRRHVGPGPRPDAGRTGHDSKVLIGRYLSVADYSVVAHGASPGPRRHRSSRWVKARQAGRRELLCAIPRSAPKYYLQKAGTGNKVLSSVALPSKWYLLWTFNCGAKRGTFKLTSTKKGQPLLAVTDQTGLGGGGQRPFTKSGTYRFAMRTTCSWKVTVASKPPSAAKSTTTTTAPKK